ncbi:MAG: hypothetical protein HXX08_15750 [Chloroflexi bacterium]|uniref:Uncharacterized protein n=1 Tax=Candidatus Chlorohelix allophototropha TaxID=3003348 RepID=A0A8T7M5G3_9CHLR|nr:hypothetical protein [Chloroflexota bacterium]WJW69231.1 hypothetical protein OZ401_002831 [Chloroflexota bacterium L227-S17]
MAQYPNQPPTGQPPYGQPPQGQPPYGQPGQPPYGQPPQGQPPYGQPGQPPYGQPPQGQPPYQQPPQYQQQAAQAMKNLTAPVAKVDAADAYDRVLSLIAYLWIIFFGFTPLLGIRIVDFGVSTTQFSFGWDFKGFFGLIAPFAIMLASRNNPLAGFHSKQAFFLAIGYVVVRAILQLFYLIPARGFQDVLLTGLLEPLIQITFAFAAVFAGVRAFLNKELYTIPVIGGFIGKPKLP